ncbi:KinB-signaling pathway activation protein [Siminovitchia fortis]|uniref:KinB-signaling pathway activation protein n=1 Tax=Siminovitchia fortis TaxID=254758 RepID=A0A443J040_9BACI|nr:KinB-signaling pathway activation protein [Siminovitchia fortis]RWR13968.1 KinB-signaling pathway activation protein [Siminovitchia fortis]WHY81183.1 KinB-signaling pathway activation protein [Siminovitchia fortis]
MTIRNWLRFFFSTLFLGGIITGIFGFLIRWSEFQPYFTEMNIGAIISTFIWLAGVGFTFSVVSQVGFFAYLFIHQFGLGVFRSLSLWNAVQIFITIVVLFDLVYLRFQNFAGEGESILPYIGLAIFILIAGLITAFFKAKTTSRTTFVSALFFMVVMTILEWLPVLATNEESWLFLVIFPLIACNAYQILVLPKYNRLSEEDRARRLEAQKNRPKKTGKTKANRT